MRASLVVLIWVYSCISVHYINGEKCLRLHNKEPKYFYQKMTPIYLFRWEYCKKTEEEGRGGEKTDKTEKRQKRKRQQKLQKREGGEVEMVSIEKRQRREAEVTFSPAPTDQFLSPVPASTSLS